MIQIILLIVDISDPQTQYYGWNLVFGATCIGLNVVVISGNYAYVTSMVSRLSLLLLIFQTQLIQYLGWYMEIRHRYIGWCCQLSLYLEIMYVAGYSTIMFVIVDISDPYKPYLVETGNQMTSVIDVLSQFSVSGNYAYVTGGIYN